MFVIRAGVGIASTQANLQNPLEPRTGGGISGGLGSRVEGFT